ncbi:hypothetical protein M409DRAFT_49370 [Zasmidium cellare ATCC 36951]|uniref:Uncharacterized protein n=1 Tax=Zasmidium cellare ATCC 36951 TaxID=1080233 RepID=A0A6A6D0F3_ZASCE|nr:uncharacterized protein M409DRAFT_49370 [Zasmidium cellare ATCC 36951]KAF2172851.1 hypothetical protein M409DRAFT_49370 [Zasmidium cellare ATCC 36951]
MRSKQRSASAAAVVVAEDEVRSREEEDSSSSSTAGIGSASDQLQRLAWPGRGREGGRGISVERGRGERTAAALHARLDALLCLLCPPRQGETQCNAATPVSHGLCCRYHMRHRPPRFIIVTRPDIIPKLNSQHSTTLSYPVTAVFFAGCLSPS